MYYRLVRMMRSAPMALILALAWPLTHAATSEIILPPDAVRPTADSGTLQLESTGYWFVEFASPPLTQGGRGQSIAEERDRFRAEAAGDGIAYAEVLRFERLWNGMSVRASAVEAGKISSLAGVHAVYPVTQVTIPEPGAAGASPDLATALAMTGADLAQTDLGLTGQGIRVGIIDSGIDYTHPDLGGCFGPGCRVEFGFDFVGDDFDFDQVEQPGDDPLDCNGHGTHVAGITGAKAATTTGVTGVAPGVTFGAYKIFGCNGSTRSDLVIAAMERAHADGMHVVNMSLGAAFQWPQFPTAVAASNLVEQGVVMVASIGNSGASGVYSAGAPGVGDNVIGVASFDNTNISALTFDVLPGGAKVPYLPLSETPDPPLSGMTPEVVFAGRGCVSTRGDEHEADVTDRIALLVRGACTFNEKYQGAVAAGALGVVIHNSAPGIFFGGGVESLGVFGVGVSLADGLAIRAQLTAGDAVSLEWTDVRVNAANPTGGLISSFSSYGLAPDLSLKPDLGAPGGLIRSTLPLARGGYGILSGTSMSSPHVAGAAALLLEARPGTDALEVRPLLQNTATPRLWSLAPQSGLTDHAHRQGAGMIDIPRAVGTRTTIVPSKLALGESEAGPSSHTLTLHNDGATDVTYTPGSVNAVSTGVSTFSPVFFVSDAGIGFDADSVTVPAGGSAEIGVTIQPATGPDLGQYGGHLTFNADDGSGVLRVPFAGFVGDYQDLVALDPGPFELPWLARLEGENFINEPDGATFTMKGDDIAHLLYHIAHPASRVTVEIEPLRQVGGARDLVVADFLLHPRSAAPTGFFLVSWDGSARVNGRRTALPMGDYRLKITALRALGDPANPEHVDTWISPVITIGRGRGRGR